MAKTMAEAIEESLDKAADQVPALAEEQAEEQAEEPETKEAPVEEKPAAKKPKFSMAALGVAMGTPETKANNKSWLVYGEPGAGKTRFAASSAEVPELGRALLVDLEAGSASIENVYTEDIDVIRPSDWPETKQVLEALLNEEHPYQTVIIDTVGKLMQFMEPFADKKGGNNKFEKWAILADTTLEFIELLHRSGMSVMVLAHTDSEKDELTGKVTKMPYFLGRKTGKEGPKIFDIIGYLYVDKHPETGDPLRVLQTEGFDGIIAKDRTDKLPVLMGNPTMTKAYDAIVNGKPGKGRD